jgi:RNA polymerase sigma factor (sigma-70 family)
VAVTPSDRAQWIAARILPLESQIRVWLRRIAPQGLETDDVIQEAYAIFWKLPDISHIRNPRTYFYQVVKRVVFEHVRKEAALGVISAPLDVESLTWLEEGFTPERILSGRQELDRLYRAITRLAEPARTIFIMRKIENLPQKVIAERLGVSEHTVENHVARGLRVILVQLSAEDEESSAGLVSLGSRQVRGGGSDA